MRLRQLLKGIGSEPRIRGPDAAGKGPGASAALIESSASAAARLPNESARPWHAQPGEVAEKMWGAADILPGEDVITDMLINPVYLTKEMSLLDLSAGLGGRLRRTTKGFGVYITGLERDPAIAARGMELSVAAGKAKHSPISAYDPASFASGRKFDCIIAREIFYEIADKPTFIAAVAACTKAKARISFADYILEPADANRPGIKAWQTVEPDASPLSTAQMVKAWAKVGVELTVHDDQTALYAKEVLAGFKRLEEFLSSGCRSDPEAPWSRPDPETKKAIRREVEIWAFRMAAIEHGMKFVRFFGLKS